ncbi:hypothetical protein DOT66_17275 [Ralstonia pseudosolanacearum]|uniref:hypothetical protein n=1 Tax=Ralstonia pseudosolanacearum TaxID=1310165 RepID=UPI000DAC9F23|nr:hypothetical protein [Ralstonia pseudosolanacearum]AZU57346.1 hypothetical protein CFM90_14755 [Ralstonia solanacearum]MCK4139322.1 hypothetical protein [Ralstonia pseudosolanacearum]RAA07361.1 hypothetical protein DOT66_17275 [Ralstonia pseudosolanacearum]UQY82362.1 hypothetical protein JNO62_16260 [Ralstonia pseudosolanacearum]
MPSRMPSRHRRWPRWLLIATLAWPLHAIAWDYTPGAIPGLVSLLGFLTVQTQAIDRAIQRFPAQREELIRARTQFDNAFPQALARTRRLIAGLPLTDDERQLLIERVLDAHQPSVATATQNEQTAHALAERVSVRAQGNQDRVNLQMLLAVVYDDRPSDELASRFTQNITFTDWPNARGTSLTMHLPFSWERVPPISPRRPDPARVAIGAWANQGGAGLSRIELVIRPTEGEPETVPGGNHEPRWLRDAVRQAVALPCRLLGWGPQSFGGRAGAWASYIVEAPGPRVPRLTGSTLVGRVFVVPTDGALVMLHMQSPATSPEQASAVRQRYEPLWNAVATTLTVTGAKPAAHEASAR